MDLDRPQGALAQSLNPLEDPSEQSLEPPQSPLQQIQSTYADLNAGSAFPAEGVKLTITTAALSPANIKGTVSAIEVVKTSANLAEPAQAGILTAHAGGGSSSPITISGSTPGESQVLAPLSKAESATADTESASHSRSANVTAEESAASSSLNAYSVQLGANDNQTQPLSQLQHAAAPVPEGHSAVSVDLSTVQSTQAEDAQDQGGASKGAGGSVQGSSREAREVALPITEEGLDSAMQELALEVRCDGLLTCFVFCE